MEPLSSPPSLAALDAWLLRRATVSDNGEALVAGYCAALVAAGLPLARLNLSMPVLHPERRGFALTWRRTGEVAFHQVANGPLGEAEFARSPINALIESEREHARWRLECGEGCDSFPVLAELKAAGLTDYRLHVVAFAPGVAILGVALAFATDRPGGFTEDEAAVLAGHVPVLGLAAYRLCLSHTLRHLLGAYVGPMTADRVLNGSIRRGEGRLISAAILFADLKGFTRLADNEDPARVVGWLDQHLEALGEGIAPAGGEILKFTGDGFLAVFPVEDGEPLPCRICAGALAAVRRGLAANRALAARRAAQGEPWLAADLVLHYGTIVYGNIGTADRLDFTAIGRAVNEASRIEALCDTLRRHVLISDSFASRCDLPLEDLGHHRLRGIEAPRRLWGIDEPSDES